MDIGIIGTGNMGRSIGIRLAELGHRVFFGARNLEKAAAAAHLAGALAQSGSNQQAAQFGEVLVWSVRGAAAADVVPDLALTARKPVIDVNNNETRNDGGIGPLGESVAHNLQRELPEACVVKAFNTLPQEIFELPAEVLREKQVNVFLASDHNAAKATVRELVEALGFRAIDFGPLRNAPMLEGLSDVVRNLARMGTPFPFSISVTELPKPIQTRLGGRQQSNLK